mmetsp:Transcript_28814/g.59957  ORF Transcript_28814/g.59957 Transcript_28814/m.59957 type:complete len:276 (+) Transcript_28814:254-1081(+)
MIFVLAVPHFCQEENVWMGNDGDVSAMGRLHPRIAIAVESDIGTPWHVGKLHAHYLIQRYPQRFQNEFPEHRKPLVEPWEMVDFVRTLGTENERDRVAAWLEPVHYLPIGDDGIVAIVLVLNGESLISHIRHKLLYGFHVDITEMFHDVIQVPINIRNRWNVRSRLHLERETLCEAILIAALVVRNKCHSCIHEIFDFHDFAIKLSSQEWFLSSCPSPTRTAQRSRVRFMAFCWIHVSCFAHHLTAGGIFLIFQDDVLTKIYQFPTPSMVDQLQR